MICELHQALLLVGFSLSSGVRFDGSAKIQICRVLIWVKRKRADSGSPPFGLGTGFEFALYSQPIRGDDG